MMQLILKLHINIYNLNITFSIKKTSAQKEAMKLVVFGALIAFGMEPAPLPRFCVLSQLQFWLV
jgi:hypothetical protein